MTTVEVKNAPDVAKENVFKSEHDVSHRRRVGLRARHRTIMAVRSSHVLKAIGFRCQPNLMTKEPVMII